MFALQMALLYVILALLFTNQYLYLFSILLTFTEIILLHKCAKQSEESQKEIKEVGNCSVVIYPEVNRLNQTMTQY